MDTTELERLVKIMRANGVTRLSVRDEKSSYELECLPLSEFLVNPPPPEFAEATTTKPGLCKQPGCDKPLGGFVSGFCRLHGLAAAGVNVGGS